MKSFTKSGAPAALQFPFQLITDRLVSVEEQIRAQSKAFDPAVVKAFLAVFRSGRMTPSEAQ